MRRALLPGWETRWVSGPSFQNGRTLPIISVSVMHEGAFGRPAMGREGQGGHCLGHKLS